MMRLIIPCIFGAALLVQMGGCKNEKLVAAGVAWDRDTATMNWSDAGKFCAKKGKRLPSIDELRGAYKSGNLDLLGVKSPFWSSTVYDGDTSFAQVVHFGSGDVFNYNKSYDYYVRCVEAP